MRTHREPFPYEELLAYCRAGGTSRLSMAVRARIRRRLETDPRWRAHRDSLRDLDLERIAARQDGMDLEAFDATRATPLCREVARTGGEVLHALLRPGDGPVAGHPRAEWDEHTTGCVYCRRTLRLVQAEVVARAAGLPAGEKLLREWLLDALYRPALDRVTRELTAPARTVATLPAEAVESTPLTLSNLRVWQIAFDADRDREAVEEVWAGEYWLPPTTPANPEPATTPLPRGGSAEDAESSRPRGPRLVLQAIERGDGFF